MYDSATNGFYTYVFRKILQWIAKKSYSPEPIANSIDQSVYYLLLEVVQKELTQPPVTREKKLRSILALFAVFWTLASIQSGNWTHILMWFWTSSIHWPTTRRVFSSFFEIVQTVLWLTSSNHSKDFLQTPYWAASILPFLNLTFVTGMFGVFSRLHSVQSVHLGSYGYINRFRTSGRTFFVYCRSAVKFCFTITKWHMRCVLYSHNCLTAGSNRIWVHWRRQLGDISK